MTKNQNKYTKCNLFGSSIKKLVLWITALQPVQREKAWCNLHSFNLVHYGGVDEKDLSDLLRKET